MLIDCTHNTHLLAVDYRGFGLSTGIPSESGLDADSDAVLKYATLNLGYKLNQITVLGQSLGSAVALGLGAKTPGLKGVIAICPFYRLSDALLDYKFAGVLPVLKPLNFSPKLQKLFSSFLNAEYDNMASALEILKYQNKLLIIHSKNDQEMPWYHSKRLWDQLEKKIGTEKVTTSKDDGFIYYQAPKNKVGALFLTEGDHSNLLTMDKVTKEVCGFIASKI